jgi:septum formation protein
VGDAPSLILASTSRYRRAQLERLGVAFECDAPDVDEAPLMQSGDAPQAIAEALAEAKAQAVAREHPGAFVLGADQLVDFEGTVLGKPGDAEGCRSQLASMRGKTHRLITAVALVAPGGGTGQTQPLRQVSRHCDVHRMTLRMLSDAEIERYVAQDRPHDCAGSYMIERAGIALFARIEGDDFSAIEGLPLMACAALLRGAGLAVP